MVVGVLNYKEAIKYFFYCNASVLYIPFTCFTVFNLVVSRFFFTEIVYVFFIPNTIYIYIFFRKDSRIIFYLLYSKLHNV